MSLRRGLAAPSFAALSLPADNAAARAPRVLVAARPHAEQTANLGAEGRS